MQKRCNGEARHTEGLPSRETASQGSGTDLGAAASPEGEGEARARNEEVCESEVVSLLTSGDG